VFAEPTPTTETPKFLSSALGFTNKIKNSLLFKSEEAIKEYLANSDRKYLNNRSDLIPIPLRRLKELL
jgi:thermostable 8-oxoguanine DNA glycosylase